MVERSEAAASSDLLRGGVLHWRRRSLLVFSSSEYLMQGHAVHAQAGGGLRQVAACFPYCALGQLPLLKSKQTVDLASAMLQILKVLGDSVKNPVRRVLFQIDSLRSELKYLGGQIADSNLIAGSEGYQSMDQVL